MLLALHLLAVPVFIWAIRNRQIAENESAVRAVLEDDGLVPEPSLPKIAQWQKGVFFAAISIIFIGIGASIALTVVSSNDPVVSKKPASPF